MTGSDPQFYLKKFFSPFRKYFSPAYPHLLELQKKIDYRFRNLDFLVRALRHRSFTFALKMRREDSNERMEFLGDAILSFIITEYLYKTFPNQGEGELTKIKSLAVSRDVLIDAAFKINLGEYLFLSISEEKSGGRTRTSILSDAFEALICAIYLDGGLKSAKQFVYQFILTELDQIIADVEKINYKSLFLEEVQGRKLGGPEYRILFEEGPDHDKSFGVEAIVNNMTLGKGYGKNKKQAEQNAAKEALIALDNLSQALSSEQSQGSA